MTYEEIRERLSLVQGVFDEIAEDDVDEQVQRHMDAAAESMNSAIARLDYTQSGGSAQQLKRRVRPS